MGRIKRFGDHWNTLAKHDPFGAILTNRGGEISPWNANEFFATGRLDADRFVADLNRIVPNGARRRALDFGCGVGRVSRGLAAHFDAVIGVDVSAAMIAGAQELNRDLANCQFVVNRSGYLSRFGSGEFDVVYSRLVLQHIPPKLLRSLIPELVRVTRDGGTLFFQLPAVIQTDSEQVFLDAPVVGNALKRSLPRTLIRAYRWVKYRWLVDESKPRMLMFGMEQERAVSLVEGAGGRIIVIEPDQALGPGGVGYEYWVTK